MEPNLLYHAWNLLALACYALAAWFAYREMGYADGRASSRIVVLLVVGAAAHAFTLAASLFTQSGIVLGLGTALSLVSWVVVLLYLVALQRQPLATLGLIVLPYAMVDVLLAWSWSGPPVPLPGTGGVAIAHSMVAIVSFGLLALAFCQAIVLLLQEWHLQKKHAGTFFHSLPALQTMERILFQVIGLGFTLLTIALISGALFANEIFGRALPFNHHVVLSIVAWVAFGALLLARAMFGWRGRVAAIWTIASYAVLTLAYFGTRFVLEILLHRR